MNKEFIPYDLALDLKQLGFDWGCFDEFIDDGKGKRYEIYDYVGVTNHETHCTAPLYQQAFRWFREEYNLDSFIQPYISPDLNIRKYVYCFGNIKEEMTHNLADKFKTQEEAELACLKKLIEIVKNK